MKKRSVWGLLTIITLLTPCMATAETLTLEDAVEKALTQNKTLTASAISLESARRTYEANWNVFLPTVNAELSTGFSTAVTEKFKTTFNFSPSLSASLSLDATIPNTLKQNALQYDLQQVNYAKQRAQIEQQTAQKFYNLIAAKENIAILENSLALASAQLASTTASYRAGAASELEFLQAQYSEHAIFPQIAQAKNQYTSDLNSFKVFLGYPLDADIDVSGDISVTLLNLPAGPELDTLVDSRYGLRYDMIQSGLQVQQSQLSLNAAKLRSYVPVTVTDSVAVRQKNANDISKGFSVTNSLTASVRLNLTGFIPGSSTQLNIQKAEDAVTTAQINQETVAISAKQSIINAIETLRLLEQTLELNKESLEISVRQYALSQDSYQNGLLSAGQLDETRQRLQQSQQNVLKAQINYLNSAYALAGELNMSITDLYEEFK